MDRDAPQGRDDGAPAEDEAAERVEEPAADAVDEQVRHDMNVANDWHPPD